MQLKLSLIIILLLLSTLSLAAPPVPAPPKMATTGHLLVDFNSGKVLAESNASSRLEPASLTKIMTAYTVFRELEAGTITLSDEVLVSKKAWRTPGSRMFIEVGKKISVEMLLKGMIIQSGNDASVALAEHTAGSEETFANLMNEHAQRLGMHSSHFVNSTGLPHDDHYTTPADITLVAAATIHEFPDFYKWYAVKDFKFNNIEQNNRNKLLWRDASVDGMKTGHTEAAGYCLVASAEQKGMRLISVVMGTDSEESRASASQSLINYGFRFFETHKLYSGGDSLTKTRVWKGSKEMIRLGLTETLSVTIPRRQYEKLEAGMEITPQIMAPIKKGQPLGKIIIKLEGELVAEVPLIALESIGEGGWIDSAKDSVLLWFE
ncbi:MAG: D-alanyl-D-alanine carboxypeptidase [Gammaproteobacteria bacterium]|nr:D-alanyl-D-alanine carboxypeptidase [Gammaproteobacteria bacterium]